MVRESLTVGRMLCLRIFSLFATHVNAYIHVGICLSNYLFLFLPRSVLEAARPTVALSP